MPAAADELIQLLTGLWIWQLYDPTVKADLFSTAIATRSGIYIIDPVPLNETQFEVLSQAGTISAVIVTNANHQRAACDFAFRLSVPIHAHPDVLATINTARSVALFELATNRGDLETIEIEGAVVGEIALYHAPNGGTLIIGDALINFEPYGFTFLPRKYCLNEEQMRRSLRKLLSRPAERMLFAHGTPILSRATDRARELLGVGESPKK